MWRFLADPRVHRESWAGPLLCIAGAALVFFKFYFTGAGLLFVGALTIYYYYDEKNPGPCTGKPSEVAPTNHLYDQLLAEKELPEADDPAQGPPAE